MDTNSMVSIVLPIYNQEKYLDISVPAVMRQEYQNIEIILVNDGSTDSSKQIIDKYRDIDHRIVVIDKENGGLVDATVTGVRAAHGKYLCFLDPDDTIGEDYIENFIRKIGDCDAVASGFYRNNCGKIMPLFLEKDHVYEGADLDLCRKELLIKRNGRRSQNPLYISRWNKMYRMEVVKQFIDIFAGCKQVSLGEDSIFTYLLLLNCKKIRATRAANSYYYNIGNQSSMMKTGAINVYLDKTHRAFDTLMNLEKRYGDEDTQAYALFYFLTESIFYRARNNRDDFHRLYQKLKKDSVYQTALRKCKHINGKLGEIDISLRQSFLSPATYQWTLSEFDTLKNAARGLKWYVQGAPVFLRNIRTKGLERALYLNRFRKDRHRAFWDLNHMLPELEKRITPILASFVGAQTDLSSCPLERNVFVFWWDDFDQAPVLVKRCLESVRSAHPDCRVIPISKKNYLEYTDIHPRILKDYNEGKISVQTFSDILRFNLLKKNGGVWIDATIYFEKEYNLLNRLETKPIESVAFSTSADFLQYKGEVCSWSGYFFASRKNSVFTQAMDTVFREYYLKYHTYSLYFFIDAALMICKVNHIDNDALRNIHHNDADMTLLAKLLNEPYDPVYRKHISKIPQKLAWSYKDDGSEDSVYAVIVNKQEENVCLQK